MDANSKTPPEGMYRTSVMLPRESIRKLRIVAALEGRNVSEEIRELVLARVAEAETTGVLKEAA